MTPLISEFISNKSFSRIGYRVLIRNETSQTQFIKSELILIKELKENGFVLEMPLNVCQRGHNLTVFFLSLDSDAKITLPNSGRLKEALFEVVAKVDKREVLKTTPERILVEIVFVQYEVFHWKKILKVYHEKQEEMNHLMMDQHSVREKDE